MPILPHIIPQSAMHRCRRHPSTPSTTTTTTQKTAVVLPHVLRLVDGEPWDLLVANLSWDETFISMMKVRKKKWWKGGTIEVLALFTLIRISLFISLDLVQDEPLSQLTQDLDVDTSLLKLDAVDLVEDAGLASQMERMKQRVEQLEKEK